MSIYRLNVLYAQPAVYQVQLAETNEGDNVQLLFQSLHRGVDSTVLVILEAVVCAAGELY